MAEKKKEDKPFVDPFNLMKTEELLKYYETHHANTPEAADKRESYEHERENNLDIFKNVQNSYLVSKRGEGKSKNTPKRHALSKKDMNLESSELLNKLLLEHIMHYTKNDKGEPNKAIVDLYKSNPHMLREYAMGKGIDYEEIKQDLIRNYRNINKSEKFADFKNALAGSLIKDIEKINRVTRELYQNITHHPKVKSHVKSNLQKTGLTLEESVSVPETLQHYGNFLQSGGKLGEDYIFAHENSLKKYSEKKK